MQNTTDIVDEVFTWIVVLAIAAAIVSSKSSATLVTDLGTTIASLTAIIVNPVQGTKQS